MAATSLPTFAANVPEKGLVQLQIPGHKKKMSFRHGAGCHEASLGFIAYGLEELKNKTWNENTMVLVKWLLYRDNWKYLPSGEKISGICEVEKNISYPTGQEDLACFLSLPWTGLETLLPFPPAYSRVDPAVYTFPPPPLLWYPAQHKYR